MQRKNKDSTKKEEMDYYYFLEIKQFMKVVIQFAINGL